MSGTVVILLYALAILVTIVIHEAAHYGVAKAFKIKVQEFFVGFGPRLWSFRRGETEYGVKALPLGGYVRIAGMNPYEEISPEEYPHTFGAKPAWQRALVIVAGPATHFVIAFALIALYLGAIGTPKYSPLVYRVEKTLNGAVSPAAEAGLKPGDEIVGVGGISHPTSDQLQQYTRNHTGQPVTLRVRRHQREITVHLRPVVDHKLGYGRIGVGLADGDYLGRDRRGFTGSITGAVSTVGAGTVAVVKSLGRVFGPQGLGRLWDLLFNGASRKPTDVTSVVGGARIAAQAAQAGFADALIQILAIFNIFVGILNLIPLPPFDGGHLAVIAIEKIRGKKVDPRKLIPITAVVAAFLLVFMMSVLYLDIVKPIPDIFTR